MVSGRFPGTILLLQPVTGSLAAPQQQLVPWRQAKIDSLVTWLSVHAPGKLPANSRATTATVHEAVASTITDGQRWSDLLAVVQQEWLKQLDSAASATSAGGACVLSETGGGPLQLCAGSQQLQPSMPPADPANGLACSVLGQSCDSSSQQLWQSMQLPQLVQWGGSSAPHTGSSSLFSLTGRLPMADNQQSLLPSALPQLPLDGSLMRGWQAQPACSGLSMQLRLPSAQDGSGSQQFAACPGALLPIGPELLALDSMPCQ